MSTRLKHIVFRFHLGVFVASLAIAVILFARGLLGSAEFYTIIGGLATFVFFVQRQELEELRLFKELFKEFNERYDKMNEGLNRIIGEPAQQPLSNNETDLLNNYFNLCGEEYLYYKRGYIGIEVWKSWKNGMSIFFKHPRVEGFWTAEVKTDSYYGLERELRRWE